jgi:hypothetical protein
MHVIFSPHLLGKIIKYYYYIIGKNVTRKLMQYCPTLFEKTLWENKSFILLLNAIFSTYVNNIYSTSNGDE